MNEMDRTYASILERVQWTTGPCIHCHIQPRTPNYASCASCREAILHTHNPMAHWRPTKPEVCPLCKNPNRALLYWHHWDDKQPQKGMWLCPHCNSIVELEERGLVDRYRELRHEALERLEQASLDNLLTWAIAV